MTFLFFAGAILQAANAQTASQVEYYEPEFFAPSHPQTAFDMVERVPGFSIEGGDKVRGLDGAVPNVLIDGRPIVSRSESAEVVLGHIPASFVQSVEVRRTEVGGISLQGYTAVANVILKNVSATWAAATIASTLANGILNSEIKAEGGIRKGPTSADARASYYRNRGQDTRGTITYLNADLLAVPGYDLATDYESDGGAVGGRFETAVGGNVTLKGNASHSRDSRQSRVAATPQATAPAYSTGSDADDRYSAFGLQLDANLSATTTFAANLLYSTASTRYSETYADLGFSGATAGFADRSEAIGQATLEHNPTANLKLTAGIEGVHNHQVQSFRLSYDNVDVPVPFDDVVIDERRVQFTVRAAWTHGDLSLIGETQWETSDIESVADEGIFQQGFSFAKPRLSLVYKPDPRTTLRITGRRRVEQLSFGDFAAAASLEFGTVNAGNVAIRPESRWELAVGLERSFWDKGAISFELTRSYLRDVVDYRLDDEGFEIVGNIGDGRQTQVKAAFELPLDRLAIPNALVRAAGTWRNSSVVDPITGEDRRRSNELYAEGVISLIKDFPELRLTVQADYTFAAEKEQFRLAERSLIHTAPRVGLSIKYKPDAAMLVNASVELATSEDFTRRERFVDSRAGELSDIELRESRPYASAGLSLRIAI